MDSKVKCVALDLDGTLLSDEKKVSEENREALMRAAEKGVHIVIASGRAYTSLPKEVLQIPGIEYAITSNGAKIYHVLTRECVRDTRMTAASVEKIRRQVKGMGMAEEIFVDGQPYAMAAYVKDPVAYGVEKHAVSYIQTTRVPVTDVEEFFQIHAGELECLDYILKDVTKRDEIWRLLEETVPDIYVTSSMPNRLEISHKDAGKRAAYEWLLGQLQIPPAQAAAFGDADNDWEMLDFVGYGIAMENATKRCKKAARAVTKKNTQSGVAYGFSTYLCI